MPTPSTPNIAKPSDAEAALIQRRHDIAQELRAGRTDAAIARKLKTSRNTVRSVRAELDAADSAGREPDFRGQRRGRKPSSVAAPELSMSTIRSPATGGKQPRPASLSEDRHIPCLLWELQAWTLGPHAEIAKLAAQLNEMKCFAPRGFSAVEKRSPVSHAISANTKKGDVPPVKFLGTKERNVYRSEVFKKHPEPARGTDNYMAQGIWSIRLVPVRVLVAGEHKQQDPVSTDPSDVTDRLIKQTRVLAMAMDLRIGGYVMELLGVALPTGSGRRSRIQGKLDLACLDIDPDGLKRFVARLAPDIEKRGGSLHLPDPSNRRGPDHNQKAVEQWAQELGIEVHTDMPGYFASTFNLPLIYLRSRDDERLWIYRNIGERVIPHQIAQVDIDEPFVPQPFHILGKKRSTRST